MKREVYRLFVFLRPIFDALYEKSTKFREKLIEFRQVKVFYQDLKKYGQPTEYNGVSINSILFTDIFMYNDIEVCCEYLSTIACEDNGEGTLDIRVWEVDYKRYPDKRNVLVPRSLYSSDLLIKYTKSVWKPCMLTNVFNQIASIYQKYGESEVKIVHVHMVEEKLTCSLYSELESEDFEIVNDGSALCNLVKILISTMELPISEIYIFVKSRKDELNSGMYYRDKNKEMVMVKS